MLHPVLPDIHVHVFANPTHVKSWHSQQQMLPEQYAYTEQKYRENEN